MILQKRERLLPWYMYIMPAFGDDAMTKVVFPLIFPSIITFFLLNC